MNRRVALFLLGALWCCLPVRAEEALVSGPRSAGRWFLSGGVTFRTLDQGIRFAPGDDALLNWENFFSPRPGTGDAGFYTGGPASVRYDDGFVGPQLPGFPPGVAQGQVTRTSQILPHPLSIPGNGFANAVVRFQTDGYSYREERGFSEELTRDDTASGPSLKAGVGLGEYGGVFINLITGWSLVGADYDTGNRRVIEVFEDFHEYTYFYDYISEANSGILLPGTVDGPDGIIYDAGLITPLYGPGYESPRKSTATEASPQPRFYAVSRSSLDVSLTELPFGMELGRVTGPLEYSLTAGATINIIDYDLQSHFAWYETGDPVPRYANRWRDAASPIKAGFFAGFGAKLFVAPRQRAYVEASTSYRWVDPVHASTGLVDVEIDVSSWEGRIGIGFVFD